MSAFKPKHQRLVLVVLAVAGALTIGTVASAGAGTSAAVRGFDGSTITVAGFGIAPMFIQQNAVIAERAGGAAPGLPGTGLQSAVRGPPIRRRAHSFRFVRAPSRNVYCDRKLTRSRSSG